MYGGSPVEDGGKGAIPADSSAAFGYSPEVTYWEMAHGAGGGDENILRWIEGKDWRILWADAGKVTRYKP
jgi:hypothetical protein